MTVVEEKKRVGVGEGFIGKGMDSESEMKAVKSPESESGEVRAEEDDDLEIAFSCG